MFWYSSYSYSTTPEALATFKQTDEYNRSQQMLAKLREPGGTPPDENEEPTRVITVRLPKSLHEALRVEAHEHCVSMNKLCISKLLQFIDNELVPSDAQRASLRKDPEVDI